jgi:hypothetical protein
MNTQERDMLNAFLTQLTQAQVGAKEPEADTLIAQALAKQPNAGYLLVQRAMQLDFVLQQSQAKVAELQAQLERQKPVAQASFLNDVHAWGRGPSAPSAGLSPVSAAASGPSGAPAMAKPAVAGAPVAGAAPAPAAAPAAATTPWGSSMMGTVATTAAGVVAGSFLYSGIQSLMGNHNSGGAFGAGNKHDNQQPASHTEVVRMVVGNEDAPQRRRQPIAREQRLPGLPHDGQPETGVHQPPTTMAARDQPHIDVV